MRCSAETIFDLIVDFRGQERWLGKSSAFRGTHAISSNPVVLGTTYREPGPFGVRDGTVTEFERPTRVAFHQPMTLRLHTGTIDVLMRYALTSDPQSTHVRRVVTVDIPRALVVLQPILRRAFSHESRRTLLALKAYADTLA
ncbi:MAG TPA: SRPBCC family protein [Solirubrobacteraceae bacterium]|nr:SRPBCC family protein [Solirubrobacteraceae bacterium]